MLWRLTKFLTRLLYSNYTQVTTSSTERTSHLKFHSFSPFAFTSVQFRFDSAWNSYLRYLKYNFTQNFFFQFNERKEKLVGSSTLHRHHQKYQPIDWSATKKSLFYLYLQFFIIFPIGKSRFNLADKLLEAIQIFNEARCWCKSEIVIIQEVLVWVKFSTWIYWMKKRRWLS